MEGEEQPDEKYGSGKGYELQPQRASLFTGLAAGWMFAGIGSLLTNLGILDLEFTWWVWMLGAGLAFGLSYVKYRDEREPVTEVQA